MLEVICVREIEGYVIGKKYLAVGKEKISYDRYNEGEVYIFYADYDYDYDNWYTESICTSYFMTPAEWREHQINSILND